MTLFRKYKITVKEVYTRSYIIHSQDVARALRGIELVAGSREEAESVKDSFEFSHLLNSNLWTVEEMNE